MSFPRYPKYKDSGVEWLGEVPEHWEVVSMKRIASIRYGIGEPPPYHDEGTPLVRATNIHAGRLNPAGMVFIDPDDIPEQRTVWLVAGDIVVVRSGAYTGDSAIIPAGFGPSIAGFDMVLQCHSAVPQFVQFALLSTYLKERQIDLEKMRAAQPHLNAQELGSCLVFLPHRDEQLAIAAFLDRETAKIDALVEEQRRLIELLKEKRQAVISHAVTKGLNPDVPMKPSGIDWLGDVPEHWEIEKLGFLCTKIGSGKTPLGGSESYTVQGVVFIRSQNVTDEGLSLDDVVYITEETDFEMRGSQVHGGDILLNITGASLGRTCLVPDEFSNANVNQHVCIIRLRDKDKRQFVAMVMKSAEMRAQIDAAQTGAAREGLNFAQISKLVLAIPPFSEQSAITSFLDQVTSRIDALIAEAERAIELLQERRTALISAAVTGKIDVRGLAAHAEAA